MHDADPETATPPEITDLKPLHRSTPLVRDGAARATIVVPTGGRHDAAATRIRDAIADASGVRVPIVPADTPEATLPVERHAIVLGNRATNDTIAKLYDRYLTMLDAKYPGPGGHVLRSVHDPFGNGSNVVLVGGSDDAGVERATECLLQRLAKAREEGADGSVRLEDGSVTLEDGSVTLGWLQDVQVSPEYDLPEVGEESATVAHWGQAHAMGERNHNQFGWNSLSRNMALYFMTGEERYAEEFLRLREPDERAREQLREWDGRAFQNLDDPLSNMMHYNHHRTVLLWELIEESPVFTDEQRLAVTRSLRAEYEHRLGEEFYGLIQPAHDVGGRHQQFEALAQLVLARYFKKSYPDAFWERAHEGAANVFRALSETPQLGATECENLYFYASYLQASVEYVLLTGDREPMDAGTLPKLFADLDALHSGRGRHWSLSCCAPNLANAIAHLTGEDHWLAYREDMALDTDRFRVGQSFWPGEADSGADDSIEATADDSEPTRPEHLVGEWSINRMAHQYWAESVEGVPEDEAFLWASWRSQADASGDFVLLDGHDGGGRNRFHRLAIPELRIDGQTILQGESWTNLGHFNQVRTLADGLVGDTVCTTAALTDRGHLGDTAFAVSEVADSGCGEWRRTLAQRVGRFAVIADEVTATRDAENFEIRTCWQGFDARWNAEEGALELPDRDSDADDESDADRESEADSGSDAPVGRVRFADPVEVEVENGTASMVQRFATTAGDRTINVSLCHPDVERPNAWSCRRLSPSTVALETPEPTIVTVADEDADLAIRSAEHFFGLGVEQWIEDGTTLLAAEHPIAVDWSLADGNLVVRADEPTRVTYREEDGDRTETTVEGERTLTGATLSEEHRARVGDSIVATVEAADGTEAERPATDQVRAEPRASELRSPSADAAIEPAWERGVDGPVETVEHVTIEGESRWLVGAGDSTVVFDARGERVATLSGDAPVSAVHYWPDATADGRALIVTGHMDQQVHAWHPDGEHVWSYRTRMTEEVVATGQDQWFQEARPGVRGLASHPEFHDGEPTLFVGSACSLELLDAQGEPTRRLSVFWGIPHHFEAIEDSDGTTAMVIGKQPGDDMAAAILRPDGHDLDETRFDTVPSGHDQVSNWGSIVRQADRFADLDGDGDRELVGALTGYWNRVTTWKPDGTAVANAQFGPGQGGLQQSFEQNSPNYRIRDFAVVTPEDTTDERDATGRRPPVLVGTREGYLVALADYLDHEWSRQLGSSVEVVETIDGNNARYRIVAGTGDGAVLVLDPTGGFDGHADLGAAVASLDADGSTERVGIGTADGRLVTFSP